MGAKKWREPEHDNLLRELRGRREKIIIIARIMGFSKETICKKMRKLGLSNRGRKGMGVGPVLELIDRDKAITREYMDGPLTQKQLASKYNLTDQRISQITIKYRENG